MKYQHSKSLMMGTAILAMTLLIVSSFMHLTPYAFAEFIMDYSTHHYFITAFVLLVVFTFSVKYYSFDPTDKELAGKSNSERLKIRMKRRSDSVIQYGRLLAGRLNKRSSGEEARVNVEDVLNDPDERLKRERDLNNAMKLGNTFRHKVRILFEDLGRKREVESTVWFASNKHISLKNGEVIPVKKIYSVKF